MGTCPTPRRIRLVQRTILSIFPAPPSSKKAVNRAGKAIASGTAIDSDYALVDQWRAAHGYVINTFQIFFKRRIETIECGAEFAQRLKRRNTVIDKISRTHPDGSLLMGDVTSMHDFAGCRLIFNSVDELNNFRKYVHSSASMGNVYHKLRHDLDKYDYIAHPKPSGYRGIHDVFSHHPRPHRRKVPASTPWQGLFVEVQYRTRVQHAWATALEISDIIDGQRTKFDLTESKRVRFFAVASELLARKYEGISNSLTNLNYDDIINEFNDLENELGILRRLEALRQSIGFEKIKIHNVLNIMKNENEEMRLEIENFKNSALAIKRATELEADENSINAVYVRADNPAQARSAYRNYFNDPVDFVKLVKDALRA